MVVLYFSCNFDVVVWRGQPCLPTSPSWQEDNTKVFILGPGCGNLVDWVLACKPKGLWFDSQSGHMPELQTGCPVGGAQKTTTHWGFSRALSPPFPLSLKINKFNFFLSFYFRFSTYTIISSVNHDTFISSFHILSAFICYSELHLFGLQYNNDWKLW